MIAPDAKKILAKYEHGTICLDELGVNALGGPACSKAILHCGDVIISKGMIVKDRQRGLGVDEDFRPVPRRASQEEIDSAIMVTPEDSRAVVAAMKAWAQAMVGPIVALKRAEQDL